MPNIKSQIKRDKTNLKCAEKNQALKSKIKSQSKKVISSVEGKDPETAKKELDLFFKTLDKAEKSGTVHKNYVANKKSKAAKLVNSIGKE